MNGNKRCEAVVGRPGQAARLGLNAAPGAVRPDVLAPRLFERLPASLD